MNVVRTAIWMILTALVVGFVVLNWGEPQPVRIWPGGEDNYVVDWPVGVMALVFFLSGFVPMWLYHRGVKWSLNRRIAALENAARLNAVVSSPPAAPPASPSPAATETLSSEESSLP